MWCMGRYKANIMITLFTSSIGKRKNCILHLLFLLRAIKDQFPEKPQDTVIYYLSIIKLYITLSSLLIHTIY